MTGFAIGMLAVALWGVVIAGLVWLFRGGKGKNPMKQFQKDQQSLNRLVPPEPEPELPPLEVISPVADSPLNAEYVPTMETTFVDEEPSDEEFAVLPMVIDSPHFEPASKPAVAQPRPSSRRSPRSSRSHKKVSVIRVDDEGRPQT